jgi:two-component system response regulator
MNTGQKVDILLIEDNSYEAEITTRSFRNCNLTNGVLCIADGAEALDYIFARRKYASRNAQDIPKLILLDLNLPKVSGLEILEAVKKNEGTKSIPVIVLTSSREEADIIDSYKLGVNSYIVKPVDYDSFSKAVVELGMYWMLLNVSPSG